MATLRYNDPRDSQARKRCMERDGIYARRVLERFLQRADAASRSIDEPIALDMERTRGSLLVNKQIQPGDSILIHSRTHDFRILFTGFDRQDRLRCRLYIDDGYARSRLLRQGEALECDDALRLTRCKTYDRPECATISVWADVTSSG